MAENKILSTLGFVFSPDLKSVLLILKHKPEAHKGRFNALGGKLEIGESVLHCLTREIEEEAGLITKKHRWIKIGRMSWIDWVVEIFVYQLAPREFSSLKLDLDQDEVKWFPVNELPSNVITNLPWLIPMCLDRLHGKDFTVKIQYQDK